MRDEFRIIGMRDATQKHDESSPRFRIEIVGREHDAKARATRVAPVERHERAEMPMRMQQRRMFDARAISKTQPSPR